MTRYTCSRGSVIFDNDNSHDALAPLSLGTARTLSALSKHAAFGVAQQGELARLCEYDGWRPAKKLEGNLAKQLAKKLANKLA